MKVKKFNESFSMDDEGSNEMKKSPRLSDKVNEFVIDFNESTDYGIIDYISDLSNKNLTILSEYKNLYTEKRLMDFGREKKLKALEQYGEVQNEYSAVNKEIIELEKKVKKYIHKKQKLYTVASSQLLYKFQEDLFLKDFKGLYNIFIVDSIDNDDEILAEIHPDIVTKYGDLIIEQIQPLLSAKKFNI